MSGEDFLEFLLLSGYSGAGTPVDAPVREAIGDVPEMGFLTRCDVAVIRAEKYTRIPDD